MSITYPIYPPQLPGDAVIEPVLNTAVAIARSPYTSQAQTQEFPGESLGLKVRMPKMNEADGRAWVGFLASLWGPAGSCYFGDWMARSPQGGISQLRNLLVNSDAFSSSQWIHQGVAPIVVTEDAATATAPATAIDGRLVDQIAFPATALGEVSDVTQVVTPLLVAGRRFTFSVWLSATGSADVLVILADTPGGVQTFAVPVTLTSAWTRVSISGVFPARVAQGASTLLCEPSRGLAAIIRKTQSQGAKTVFAGLSQLELGTLTAEQIVGAGVTVNGAQAAGSKTLAVTMGIPAFGLPPNLWRRGDWLAVGRLHMLMSDLNIDNTGHATADIFPRLRSALAGGEQINWWNPMGLFRLVGNQRGWSVDEAMVYGLDFELEEAL